MVAGRSLAGGTAEPEEAPRRAAHRSRCRAARTKPSRRYEAGLRGKAPRALTVLPLSSTLNVIHLYCKCVATNRRRQRARKSGKLPPAEPCMCPAVNPVTLRRARPAAARLRARTQP